VPEVCPPARTIAKEKEIDIAYRCTNLGCPAQLARGIVHLPAATPWISKGWGNRCRAAGGNASLVKDIADIYFLERKELLGLNSLREKAENLLKAIERARRVPCRAFSTGLGIGTWGKAVTHARRSF